MNPDLSRVHPHRTPRAWRVVDDAAFLHTQSTSVHTARIDAYTVQVERRCAFVRARTVLLDRRAAS